MKRVIVAAACAIGFACAIAAPASAEWPNDRPIRLIVGFGAGGGTDIVARIVAQPLSELLHQSVVVENKPGAGGSIASGEVARAAKDGYTATMLSTGHTVGAAMLKNVPYDAVKDFAPVGLVANSAFVIVANKDFAANDIKGLIALAKASPGKLNFASVGIGSTQHIAGELLVQSAGINVKHIPYRGSPALVAALLAGQVDYGVETFQAVQGRRRIRRPRLRRLRVVWLGLSGRDAASHRRQDPCRVENGAGDAGRARPAEQGRRRCGAHDAGGIRHTAGRRGCQMESGARQGRP